ncbi:hypothetical protein [Sinomonas gamaensis]|uniref:hypothetical protein n=1 Tax=Sinomonas gamaensis TaxID=2565624 RepID=UPI001BB16BF3|nr:hypothetical protein [Sinomonas gamaensis]
MSRMEADLQFNAFEPIIARSLFARLSDLTAQCTALAEHCISGITANRDNLRSQVEASIGVVTVLERGLPGAEELGELALSGRLANQRKAASSP